MSFTVAKHTLVPKHTKLSKEDKKALLDKHHITTKELPKIFKIDPGIMHLECEVGDVIKIERKSPTAGKSTYYRVVARG